MKQFENDNQKLTISFSDLKIATLAGVFILISIFSSSKGRSASATNRQHTVIAASFFPIELSSFSAKADLKKVKLTWSTSKEINSSHFVIQRITDRSSFQDAALLFTQEGDRTSQTDYHFTDSPETVKDGQVWYRLKMVGADGSVNYSDVVSVRQENAGNLISYTGKKK
jgi:hypothetical protein